MAFNARTLTYEEAFDSIKALPYMEKQNAKLVPRAIGDTAIYLNAINF